LLFFFLHLVRFSPMYTATAHLLQEKHQIYNASP
jgi:hypothetical protein